MPNETRIAHVKDRAAEVFGDRDAGLRWLEQPNRALNGLKPAELLTSESGTHYVEQMLGRIEHGIAA